jgi:hypothetical protein
LLERCLQLTLDAPNKSQLNISFQAESRLQKHIWLNRKTFSFHGKILRFFEMSQKRRKNLVFNNKNIKAFILRSKNSPFAVSGLDG